MYLNNIKHGKGCLIYQDGHKVEGIFNNGNMDEENVTINYPNGVVYKGEIENKKLNGQGKFTFINGNIFRGQFENNVSNGPGSYETQKMTFKANFKNGIPTGIGQIYSKAGKSLIEEVIWNRDLWEAKTQTSIEYLKVENFDK